VIDIRRAMAIDGYMAEAELLWLAERATECRVIVEVGSYKGRSTRALADHCPGVVYAIDPWDGGYKNDDGTQARWLDTKGARMRFDENLVDHVVSGKVIVHQGVLADVQVEALRADLLFIDGDHRYLAVRDDITLGQKIVRSGGILCGHDYGHKTWPGVKRAVHEMFGRAVNIQPPSIWWVRL